MVGGAAHSGRHDHGHSGVLIKNWYTHDLVERRPVLDEEAAKGKSPYLRVPPASGSQICFFFFYVPDPSLVNNNVSGRGFSPAAPAKTPINPTDDWPSSRTRHWLFPDCISNGLKFCSSVSTLNDD